MRWPWTAALFVFLASETARAEKPCEDYPVKKRTRCEAVWKQINDEELGAVAEFGLRQLKRRQEGTITPEQHLKENMEFIKASGEKRLRLLSERMERE
jgi:hypothetical protein